MTTLNSVYIRPSGVANPITLQQRHGNTSCVLPSSRTLK
ncbi:hypothetical protein E2C01_091454 [Portunus trituberculatus]|uniref:Uncharacterized protein n=1 Tax=Portunus trituberculatus TaxID=210409 RepID=A0A5B7JHJ6_PORTR|nr:hypothetical protein [Portunus trituberculatus]